MLGRRNGRLLDKADSGSRTRCRVANLREPPSTSGRSSRPRVVRPELLTYASFNAGARSLDRVSDSLWALLRESAARAFRPARGSAIAVSSLQEGFLIYSL